MSTQGYKTDSIRVISYDACTAIVVFLDTQWNCPIEAFLVNTHGYEIAFV